MKFFSSVRIAKIVAGVTVAPAMMWMLLINIMYLVEQRELGRISENWLLGLLVLVSAFLSSLAILYINTQALKSPEQVKKMSDKFDELRWKWEKHYKDQIEELKKEKAVYEKLNKELLDDIKK